MRLLISGYGGSSRQTAGIFDCESRRFVWESGLPSISFLCEGDGRCFFGAGEFDDYGEVYMFISENGTTRLADTLRVPGGSLCHIAYSPKNKLLAGACYGNGDLFAVRVNPDGFGETTAYLRQGAGEEGLSRAHCAVFSADESCLYSANIALDRIYCYTIDCGSGTLQDNSYAQLTKGVGPRHIAVFPDMLYVITEYSNEIITLPLPPKLDGLDGLDGPEGLTAPFNPSVSGVVGTLPNGFDGKSYCSTLFCSENNLIYAANRGADTIAVFTRSPNGSLAKIHDCACAGQWPRHIAQIGHAQTTLRGTDGRVYTGPFLAVANEHSGRVSVCSFMADGSVGAEVLVIPFEGASFVGMC